MPYKYVEVEARENVGIITINNPPANALASHVFEEIGGALGGLKNNQSVGCIILTGKGKFFSAGADIKEIQTLRTSAEAEKMCRDDHEVLYSIQNSDIPVIAAVNGYALGGGNELAMACHIRFASERAKFGQPEINLGIMPGLGGTQRLARFVGLAKSLELNLTGDIISAKEAKEIGLVNAVFPDAEFMSRVLEIAKKIASKSRSAVAFILKAHWEGVKKNLDDALKLETKLFGEIILTTDSKEGISAFLEKRPPKWS